MSGSLPDATSIDIKSGSLGVGVMLIGALMVTTAAIHINEYKTVTIPAFQPSTAFVNALGTTKTNNSNNIDIRNLIPCMSTGIDTEGGHNKNIDTCLIKSSNFPIKKKQERDEHNGK
ncbi:MULTISPECIES: hypothetical protein [unclassified Pseudoalteromonas]|uniref:hypothetical protein n=1 Tax=unclassified Pseudoalteromonas TaxID=194690 RepID=UPI0025B47110|nr:MULTISPECIES: hypothetical protein [unclassified Pseudoalteromonas]MDN3378714.1 hypothetical protein [Pseudoalteromonas sp. APC 3893]MDN3387203.1 hypothetical protein [Pseudoalteromonas sp. APC 4017]